MKKVKRPYTKTNSSCFGSNKNKVKKLYIKDSRLYLGEGIKKVELLELLQHH